MIGRLTGSLLEKQPPLVLVDVQGVGYEISVPMSTFYQLPAIGEQITLQTHLIVREDAHFLFGFGTQAERHVFRQLMKITGIGARTSLALLSGLSVTDINHAVATQDSSRLVSIPGIGKKTAERLLLELRDKLEIIESSTTSGDTETSDSNNDIRHALLSLGYNEREALWAIKMVEPTSVSNGIRQALKLLSKNK